MHKYTYNALLYHTAVIPVSHQVVGGDMEIVAKYLKLNVRHQAFSLLNSEDGQFAEIIAPAPVAGQPFPSGIVFLLLRSLKI